VIDLHTHTTASDGRCSPAELVTRCRAAGVQVLSVTDHDTTAGLSEAAVACDNAGIELIPGIEITAVVDDLDVHVLGYFFDRQSAALARFLGIQRERRVERVRLMLNRLAQLGIGLDAEAILRPAIDGGAEGRAAGRPWIARALVAAGHVENTSEAFDRYLKRGAPAFVPRVGPTPGEAFAQVHAAGGIASLAHPGLLKRENLVLQLVSAGLDALEAHHSKHSPVDTSRYLALAAAHDLGVSGGSDFHGDPSHDAGGPGSTALPRERFQDLKGRWATRRARAAGLSTSS
jgi:predicted metal-dependent phosphoesterase TrpH